MTKGKYVFILYKVSKTDITSEYHKAIKRNAYTVVALFNNMLLFSVRTDALKTLLTKHKQSQIILNAHTAKNCEFSKDGFHCREVTLSFEDLLNEDTQKGVFVGFA